MFSEQLGSGGHLPSLSVTEAVPSLISFDPPSNLCDKNYDNLPNFTAENTEAQRGYHVGLTSSVERVAELALPQLEVLPSSHCPSGLDVLPWPLVSPRRLGCSGPLSRKDKACPLNARIGVWYTGAQKALCCALPSFSHIQSSDRQSLSSTKFIKSGALSLLSSPKENFSRAQMVALRLELPGSTGGEALPERT